MAIKAIGAQPQINQSTVPRSREGAVSDEVQSGDVTAVPQVEETGGGQQGSESATDRDASRSLAQALDVLDLSVREKLSAAVGRPDFDVQEDEEIQALASGLRESLGKAHEAEAADEDLGFIVQTEAVREAVDIFTSGLIVTLESLLPPVPWEATIPPDPQDDDGSTPTVGPQGVDTFA